MPTSWLSTWRTLACKTQANDVHDPKSHIYHHHTHYNDNNYSCSGSADQRGGGRAALEIASTSGGAAVGGSKRSLIGGGGGGGGQRSGCSRSIANLRDVIHSSRRIEAGFISSSSAGGGAATNFSPKSVESTDFVQSISHEAMLKSHPILSSDHVLHPPIFKSSSLESTNSKLSLDDIVANYYPLHSGNYNRESSAGNSTNYAHKGHSGGFYGTPLHPTSTPSSNSHHATRTHFSAGSDKTTSCGGGGIVGGNSLMKLSGCYDCKNPAVSLVIYKTSSGSNYGAPAAGAAAGSAGCGALPAALTTPVCRRCGEVFPRYEALEKHHLLKHLVSELGVGDSSRNVVEIIFRTSWLKGGWPAAAVGDCKSGSRGTDENGSGGGGGGGGWVRIDKVLKVNNLARTVARFEAYREGVKSKASRLKKKHPRCLADGNELLRFYAAKLECDLGSSSASGSTACASPTCPICRIIRCGFSKSRAADGTNRGILTTATSGRAHDLLLLHNHDNGGGAAPHRNHSSNNNHQMSSSSAASPSSPCSSGMAMIVCRVIAGRIHKPPPPGSSSSSAAGAIDTSAFDSVAGGDVGSAAATAAGLQSRFEELTVFTPRAILPCFLVLYAAG